jgi:hypothetical protein
MKLFFLIYFSAKKYKKQRKSKKSKYDIFLMDRPASPL